MMVYKFTSAKWAKVAIRDMRLKLSIFTELNDPFELSGFNLRDPAMRAFHKEQHKKISDEYGMISFSEDYRSPLLWSHYADQHAGVCLGFEVPDDQLLKVRYRKDRFKLDGQTNLTKKDLINLLTVKFSEWRYERERRIMTPLKIAIKDANKYFEPFSEKLVLREVLLGIKCPLSEEVFKKIVERKYKNYDPVYVRQLSLAVTKFGVTKTMHKPINL